MRLFLGVFLAFFGAAIGYMIAWMIVMSVWVPTPATTLVMATSGVGVGAGFGGALGWIVMDSSKPRISFIMIVGILGALAGAWAGLYYGRTVYIMSGMPGIAELMGIVRGAAIGGNIPPIVLGVVRTLKHGDV